MESYDTATLQGATRMFHFLMSAVGIFASISHNKKCTRLFKYICFMQEMTPLVKHHMLLVVFGSKCIFLSKESP
jgi:hypothetical protein